MKAVSVSFPTIKLLSRFPFAVWDLLRVLTRFQCFFCLTIFHHELFKRSRQVCFPAVRALWWHPDSLHLVQKILHFPYLSLFLICLQCNFGVLFSPPLQFYLQYCPYWTGFLSTLFVDWTLEQIASGSIRPSSDSYPFFFLCDLRLWLLLFCCFPSRTGSFEESRTGYRLKSSCIIPHSKYDLTTKSNNHLIIRQSFCNRLVFLISFHRIF